MANGALLLQKGRVLTPRSRLRYRLSRLGIGKGPALRFEDELSLVSVALRIVTLPVLTLVDVVSWPVIRRSQRSAPWWVVEVRFHGPDAEFVRIAEAPNQAAAEDRRTELLTARAA